MATLKYLIDTSGVVRLHRPAVQEVLLPLIEVVARCTVTDLEVGARARNAAEWDAYIAGCSDFPPLPVPSDAFDEAARVQRVLAERGVRGRKIPDLLIAATAHSFDLTVLHYDRDFDFIADVTGQKTQWILPAGSVD